MVLPGVKRINATGRLQRSPLESTLACVDTTALAKKIPTGEWVGIFESGVRATRVMKILRELLMVPRHFRFARMER